MRKIPLFYQLCLFTVLALAGCQQDKMADILTDTTDEFVRLSTSIQPSGNTRALIQDNGKGTFEPEDAIRLYTVSDTQGTNDYTLTYDGACWQPAPKWTEVGDRARFTALYPAPSSGQIETGYTHTTGKSAIRNRRAIFSSPKSNSWLPIVMASYPIRFIISTSTSPWKRL